MSNQLETIVIDGKEIDLSTATRDDLIHYLHIYVSAWQKAKQDFFNVQRFFAIALKQLGGKMDIDRRELLEVSGTEVERTEEDSRTLRFCISNHNNPMPNTEQQRECDHDTRNAVFVSRGLWVCPKCKKDISLEYVVLQKALHPELYGE